MRFVELPIPGAYRIELDRMVDERGFFARTFCSQEFASHRLVTGFEQRSVSHNISKGTLRGLHYQAAPHSEIKLVRCTAGVAFDVLVDLRRSSPKFGRWHAEIISAENSAMMYIPAGCAHGFQTLADSTTLAYEITPAYRPDAARGLAYDDPALGVAWPLSNPILSAADRARPRLAEAETFE